MGVPDPPSSCAAGQSVNDGGGASGEASVGPGDVGAGQRSDTVAGILVTGATGGDATHAAMQNMADVSWQTLFLQASPAAQPSRCSGAAAEFWVLNFGSSLVQAAMIILMFVALYIWWRWIAKMEAAEAEKYQVQFSALQIHHT